ncbi:hypothetical protein M2138_000813 [Dysgonomonadaceae bacterium PH5-43]|nr:hypothetical protein [Dysgonomonadaceae bacterium PH5-43]
MSILIHKPFSISETETGIKNSDIIYPNSDSVNKRDRLFITCGNNNSDIAGKLLCESINLYFNSFLDKEDEVSPDFLAKAIRMGEIAISDYKKNNPNKRGINTTFSLFFLASDCIYICQIGNSHIYQIRDNLITHKYIDLSDQVIRGADYPVKINLISLTDIKANDQFFICQGNLTTSDEDSIINILSEFASSDEKLLQIKNYYLNKYKSHFSGHLIPIKEVKEEQSFKQRVNALVYSFI